MNILSNSTLYQVHYLTNSTAIVSGEDISFAMECGIPRGNKDAGGLGK